MNTLSAKWIPHRIKKCTVLWFQRQPIPLSLHMVSYHILDKTFKCSLLSLTSFTGAQSLQDWTRYEATASMIDWNVDRKWWKHDCSASLGMLTFSQKIHKPIQAVVTVYSFARGNNLQLARSQKRLCISQSITTSMTIRLELFYQKLWHHDLLSHKSLFGTSEHLNLSNVIVQSIAIKEG